MPIHSAALVTGAIAAAFAFTAPARAAQPAPYTELVHYGDLDLASAAGAATLDQRIHDAAERICSAAVDDYLVRPIYEQTCVTEAFQESRRPVVTMMAAIQRGDRYAARKPVIVVGAP